MKRNFIYLFSLLFTLLWVSCSDKDDSGSGDEDLNPSQKAVQQLIVSGGNILEEEEYHNEQIIGKPDTLAQQKYTDPFTGESYQSIPVKTTRRISMSQNPDEFATLNPWADVIWPGCLVQGATVNKGVPAPVNVSVKKRKPARIYLYGVTGNKAMDTWYKELSDVSAPTVIQAQNELLSNHLNVPTPASISYNIETVSSTAELALKLDVSFKLFGGKLESKFGNTWDESKSYVAVKLNQSYFTMAFSPEEGSGVKGMFTDDIEPDDINMFTGPGNPLCYVSTVTYGRSIILLFESTSDARTLEASLHGTFGSFETTDSLRQKKVVENCKVSLVQYGGNAKDGLDAVFGIVDKSGKVNVDQLKEALSRGVNVSADSPGAPISFKINHLKDNLPVALTNTLNYSFTSMEFLRADVKNDVLIDIQRATMNNWADGKWNVSNHSKMTIEEMKLYTYDPMDESKAIKEFKFTSNSYPGKIGASLGSKGAIDLAFFKAVAFPDVPKNHRIRIYCKVNIYNEAHRSWHSNTKHSYPYELIQDFKFDEDANKWSPIQGKSDSEYVEPFKCLKINKSLGDITNDFRLTYQFTASGRKYQFGVDDNDN